MKNSDLRPLKDPETKKKALKLLKRILRSIKLLGIFFSKIVNSLDSKVRRNKDKTTGIQAGKFMSMCITLNTLLRSSFISYKYSTYLARVVILDEKREWIKSRNDAKRLSKEFEGLHYLNKFVNTADARRLVRLNSFNKLKNDGLQFRSMKNMYKKRGSVKMFGLNIEQVIKASEYQGSAVIKEDRGEDSLASSSDSSSEVSIDIHTVNNKNSNISPILPKVYSKVPKAGKYKGSNFKILAKEINLIKSGDKKNWPDFLPERTQTPRARLTHEEIPDGIEALETQRSNFVNSGERQEKPSRFKFMFKRQTTLDEKVKNVVVRAKKEKDKIEEEDEETKRHRADVQRKNEEEIILHEKKLIKEERKRRILKKAKSGEDTAVFLSWKKERDFTEEEIIRVDELTRDKMTMEEFLAHLNLDLRTNLDHVFNSNLEEILEFFNSVEHFMISILGGQELEVKIDLIKLIIRTTNAETFAEKIFMVSLMNLGFLQQWQTFDLFIQVLKFEMKLGIGF